MYSSRWGSIAPNNFAGGIQVQINQGLITAISTERLPIPTDGYVLVGPAAGIPNILKVDDKVGLQVYTAPDWSDVQSAVSGGPYLVKDGQIYVDLREQSFRVGEFSQAAPRTAVGFTRNNHLLMVTVDGRQKNVSVGATLTEMARIMKELGAIEAMNFDGGSSTQMVVNGRVVNSPTVAGGARVSSSLIVRHVPAPLSREVIGVTPDDNTFVRPHF